MLILFYIMRILFISVCWLVCGSLTADHPPSYLLFVQHLHSSLAEGPTNNCWIWGFCWMTTVPVPRLLSTFPNSSGWNWKGNLRIIQKVREHKCESIRSPGSAVKSVNHGKTLHYKKKWRNVPMGAWKQSGKNGFGSYYQVKPRQKPFLFVR